MTLAFDGEEVRHARHYQTPEHQRLAHLDRVRRKYHERPEIRARIKRWQLNNRDKVRVYAMLKNAKDRAAERGLAFELTLADIVIPEVCPVLGIPMSFGEGEAHDGSPSIDRIRPELGYVKSNIAIISRRANTIKSFGTAEEHRRIAEWIDATA